MIDTRNIEKELKEVYEGLKIIKVKKPEIILTLKGVIIGLQLDSENRASA